MHAAAVAYDLHIPVSRSLKTKRSVVRPIVEGLRQRFRVSVAEVDHHDQWQRAEVAVAVVAATGTHLHEILDACERFVYSRPDVEVLDVTTTFLEA